MASSHPTMRLLAQAIALVAAVGGIASLLASKAQSSAFYDNDKKTHGMRRLSTIDPKSVELRQPSPLSAIATSDRQQQQQPQMNGPARVVPAPLEELHKFQFHTAHENCVPAQEIIDITEFIKELYFKHGVRTFPRNGFLLGIVRHGGFLPIEGVDVDMGVVFEDLLPIMQVEVESKWQHLNLRPQRTVSKLGDYNVRLDPTEKFWVNWKGKEPVSQKPYPYFGAMISRGPYRLHAYAAYPYRDTGGYVYPRLDKAGFNHEVHVKDAIRYNTEGGDYRLVDTDERANESNFKDGVQIASYFNTNFDCLMEVQFYFTTILVPCDYDAILTSQYGNGWRNVEKRGPHGGPRHVTKAVSEKENESILNGGPRPLCVS